MPVQIVMDRHGDSRHLFDAADAQSLAEAEARFTKLLREGYLPVAPGERGKPGLLAKLWDCDNFWPFCSRRAKAREWRSSGP
jgi:hypothetical protein